MSIPIEYASFLVRMWREAEAGQEGRQAWHSEVEHIQTGQRWAFETLDELLDLLRREAATTSARMSSGNNGVFTCHWW